MRRRRLGGGGLPKESPSRVRTLASCRRRSGAALAKSGSPKSWPGSGTVRFVVMTALVLLARPDDLVEFEWLVVDVVQVAVETHALASSKTVPILT